MLQILSTSSKIIIQQQNLLLNVMIKASHQNNIEKVCCLESTCIQCEVGSVEREIFEYLQLSQSYHVHLISLENGEKLKTYFIRSNTKTERVFYLGHGFGGTSLMYFPLIKDLLKKGSLVLWQIRGMGLNINKVDYSAIRSEQTENFYNEGLLSILSYYNHEKISFISHSFGAYITMRFLIKHGKDFNIQKCILLSPIGITPQHLDYKNRCRSYSDLIHHIVSWVAWKYNITYNSLLRNLHGYLKLKLLQGWLRKYPFQGQQQTLVIKLFDALTNIRGNSSKCFYKTFLPRVLPGKDSSIQELMEKHPYDIKTVMYYGGNSDWVDKQGAEYLSSQFENISLKKFDRCGHMLPLHVEQIKASLVKQLENFI